MNDMIKAREGKDSFKEKQTKILFLLQELSIIAYFFLFQFNYNSVFYNYDTGKMDTVSGFAAIEQRNRKCRYICRRIDPGNINTHGAKNSRSQNSYRYKR